MGSIVQLRPPDENDGLDIPAPPIDLSEATEDMQIDPEVQRVDETGSGNTVAERIAERFRTYRDCPQRKEMDRRVLACRRAYLGWKADPEAWVIREGMRQIETKKPQLSQALTGGDQLFTCQARLEGFEEDAEGAQNIIHDQIQRYGSNLQLQMALNGAIHDGTSYLLPGYRKFKQTRHKMQSMHYREQTPWWQRQSSEVIENAPFLEFQPYTDVFTHPFIEEAKNSPGAFVVKSVSPDDCKTLAREGWADPLALEKHFQDNEGSYFGDHMSIDMFGQRSYDGLFLNSIEESTHELIRCYTFDGWEYGVLDRKTLIRAMPSQQGRIPLVTYRNYPMYREHWGIPELMLILDDLRLLNEVTGLYVKSIYYTQNPMWKIKNGQAAAWKGSTFKPGGMIPVDNMDDVAPLEVSASVPALESTAGFIMNQAQRATGCSDEVAGTGSSQKTATGLHLLQTASGARFQFAVKQYSQPFVEAYQWMYDLNAMHLDEVYDMRIQGKDGGNVFKRYTPDVFAPNVDVNIVIGAATGIEQANAWLNVIKIGNGNPILDMKPIWEKMFRAMGETHVRQFFASSADAPGDALGENEQCQLAGIVAPPKQSDNHQAHIQIHQMFMATPLFATLHPDAQQRMQGHLAEHMQYMQAQMAAMGQMQQQALGQGPGGATPTQQSANGRANAVFGMGQKGADHEGATAGAA